MLAIVVAFGYFGNGFFYLYIRGAKLAKLDDTGKSWVTKKFNSSDTNNYGSDWVVAPGRLKDVKPGDTVDWWHSLFVSGGPTDNVITGVQQDVFDIRSNQPMDNDVSLNDRGLGIMKNPDGLTL